MPPLSTIVEQLQRIAPLALAEPWDNVGLLLGDASSAIERIMTCLTVTPATVREAVERQANLIISHHPVLFKSVQRLTLDDEAGQCLLPLLRHGMAVYSAHTAYDNAPGGINDQWAQRMGLHGIGPLKPMPADPSFKIVAFVPESDLNQVSSALFAAGAGRIGNYDECSFRLAGIGTFRGNDQSQPTLGTKGQHEEVQEWRLEVVCPQAKLAAVLAALRQAHSYEEPAIDVYPLHAISHGPGIGRVGAFDQPVPLQALIDRWRAAFQFSALTFAGEPQQMIRKVAIVCGAGGSLFPAAVQAGADLFFTGEMRFHDLLAAEAKRMAVVLPGHYATERPGMEILAKRLQDAFPALTVWASEMECDPLRAR